uniref:Uncharacterized protein n=1 Tax=Ditylum brightwellii TaxID=49249 RepID=A0A7S1Z2J4_9STRA
MSCLVTDEDKFLDSHPFCRANAAGQVGGAEKVDENLVALTSEAAHHGEREAVLNFLSWKRKIRTEDYTVDVLESPILDLSQTQEERSNPPTPLHEVGTWKEPSSPATASKIRLLDAAIHAFAATFGMQDGRTQERAILMLEELLMASFNQGSRTFGGMRPTLLIENESKVRIKCENAAALNIAATILACLQALPLHEATYDTLIGIGPPWMEKAKCILLTLLPSAAHLVRRVAAEGLALLATLGVSEDAHTLQSSILHSLDEVMQGNAPEGNLRKTPVESLSSARAGSLLTLACIQRAARSARLKQDARARVRSNQPGDNSDLADAAPPTMIMMTRVLPSLDTGISENDSLLVRTYAMHSFGLLISHSASSQDRGLTREEIQIYRKAVEVVEDNFLSGWTAVTADHDKGRESEKFAAEPAFLAVLLRLMTFLLPRLHLFMATDPSIASRFSSMAATVMESCSFHPSVVFEGFVFFERLFAHRHLLSNDKLSVISTGDVATSCMPFILTTLKPVQPELLADHGETEYTGCYGSLLCRRAAVLCLKMFGTSPCEEIPKKVTTSSLHAHLMTLLENTCGSRHFQHAAFYRMIFAPRAAERSACICQVLETEIISSIKVILHLDCMRKKSKRDDDRKLINWLLFARGLMVGNAGSQQNDTDEGADDDDDFTPMGVVEDAKSRARDDVLLVLGRVSPCRWQIKCQAAQLAGFVLSELGRYHLQNGNKESAHFDLIAARALCAKRCRDANNIASSPYPSSYVAFHINELISAACSTATATSDQAELPSLQNSGLRVLIYLIKFFANALDPDLAGDGTSILEQFSAQIISSIKHALSSQDSSDGPGNDNRTRLLFMSGCEALYSLIENNMVSDTVGLKRLLRLVLPTMDEIPFETYPSSKDERKKSLKTIKTSDINDTRSLPLYRVGKLQILADLWLSVDMSNRQDSAGSTLLKEMKPIEYAFASNCAAHAIDGACLEAATNEHSGQLHASGITFANVVDIDRFTKMGLIQAWPVLAACSVCLLINFLGREETESERCDEINEWLKRVAPLLFAKLHDALKVANVDISIAQENNSFLSTDVSTFNIAAKCLHGMRAVMGQKKARINDTLYSEDEAEALIGAVTKNVILPSLGLCSDWGSEVETQNNPEEKKSDVKSVAPDIDMELVEQACGFIEDLCQSRFEQKSKLGGDALIQSILLPLTALKEGMVTFDDDKNAAAVIISSCIRSCRLLTNPSCHDMEHGNFVGAMLQLSLFVLSQDKMEEKVKIEASALLKDCLINMDIGTSEKCAIAQDLASGGKWEAWKIVCATIEDGSGIPSSLDSVREALEDLNSPHRHFSSLIAIRSVLQEAVAENAFLIGCVMHGVGSSLIQLLRAYGSRELQGGEFDKQRLVVCADTMKIIMITIQHLTSPGAASPAFDDSESSMFLAVIFEVLMTIVRFNGLPNHPSRNVGADDSLGRMSAQAIVHVARSAPVAFKSAMAHLSPEDRSTLEMSVRADMSGYAAPKSTAPTKKKLNLKGFRKA